MKQLRILSIIAVFVLIFTAAPEYAPAESGQFRLPGYEKFVLKNGLTVFLMEQHEVPLVYVNLAIPAGALYDGAQSGLASLTADALQFGTQKHSKNEIEEALGFLGARYNVSASMETLKVRAYFNKKDLAAVMPLLTEIVTAPSFDPLEFDKRKKQLMLELKQERESPQSMLFSYYGKFIFGEHPYGNPVQGVTSSVEKLTEKDVRKFYQAHFFPQGTVLAIVGDFKTPEMKEYITGQWGGWVNVPEELAAPAPAPALAFNQSRVLLVNKNDATETQFLIGGLGITRGNPDFVAVQVVNTILGGRFTSWLNTALRIKAGLTYGARSYFRYYKNSGVFAAFSYTRTEKTGEALALAVQTLEKLHKEGIDEETLKSARNYIKGQFPPDYERPQELADLLTDMYVYSFDESFINNFQADVDSVTLNKAQEIIAKYFPAKNLQFLLIGKAEAIRETAKKYGVLSEKDINDANF